MTKPKFRQKHDWISEDCYHSASRPFGYCGRQRYWCRKCLKAHRCAEIIPPNDVYCNDVYGNQAAREGK